MLKPIPLKVLIDTVTHSPLIAGARGRTYGPDKTLSNVLVQNKKVRQLSDGNLISVSGALLFFDTTNSVGSPSFKVGDRITYTDGHGDSQVKYIKEITEAKTNEGIHHYEVMLL